MIRVLVTHTRGSTPREAGAEMMVSETTTIGTIGGGQLEYMAIDRARQMLARGEDRAVMDVPLGPEIGPCCGGRVELTLDREPATRAAPEPSVLIFGAGHVGRALARALLPLPFSPRLIDQRAAELSLAAPGVPTGLARQAHDAPTRARLQALARHGAARAHRPRGYAWLGASALAAVLAVVAARPALRAGRAAGLTSPRGRAAAPA